ncbi:MAG: hypothetical protein ACFE7R_11490 [Candidatus Hodarchaeota archaeon]
MNHCISIGDEVDFVKLGTAIQLFVLVFLVVSFYAIYSTFPTMAGIGMWLMLILFPVGSCAVAVLVSEGMTEWTRPVTWGLFKRTVDSNQFNRVLQYQEKEMEVVIRGTATQTFAEACLAEPKVQKILTGTWVITDELGNDISHQQLQNFDGIAFLKMVQ